MTDRQTTIWTDCFHVMHSHGAFKVGQKVWCTRCETQAEVVSIPEPWWEYQIACKECRYARRTGKSAVMASIIAGKHRTKTGHEMERLRKVDENGKTVNDVPL